MALSPIDMERITLGELELIAERFSKAIATIKEAQSLLGIQAAAPAPQPAQPSLIIAPDNGAIPTRAPPGTPPEMTAEEQMLRDALRAKRVTPADMPPRIAAAMNGQ